MNDLEFERITNAIHKSEPGLIDRAMANVAMKTVLYCQDNGQYPPKMFPRTWLFNFLEENTIKESTYKLVKELKELEI